jgi:Lipocalin-like domain
VRRSPDRGQLAPKESKKLRSLCAISLFIAMTAMTLSGSQNRVLNDRSANEGGVNEGIRGRFIGAWRLARLEEAGPDGKIHRADCSGLLVYTRDGHMSVQVMYRNQPSNPPATATAAPVQYAQGGYEASFGTYEVNENAHTFTFHVDGALVRTLVGKDLPRAFEFSGKQLIVKSTRPEERWRVAWEHY